MPFHHLTGDCLTLRDLRKAPSRGQVTPGMQPPPHPSSLPLPSPRTCWSGLQSTLHSQVVPQILVRPQEQGRPLHQGQLHPGQRRLCFGPRSSFLSIRDRDLERQAPRDSGLQTKPEAALSEVGPLPFPPRPCPGVLGLPHAPQNAPPTLGIDSPRRGGGLGPRGPEEVIPGLSHGPDTYSKGATGRQGPRDIAPPQPPEMGTLAPARRQQLDGWMAGKKPKQASERRGASRLQDHRDHPRLSPRGTLLPPPGPLPLARPSSQVSCLPSHDQSSLSCCRAQGWSWAPALIKRPAGPRVPATPQP